MVGDVMEIMNSDRLEVDGLLLSGEELTID